jgi:hypothetical protein
LSLQRPPLSYPCVFRSVSVNACFGTECPRYFEKRLSNRPVPSTRRDWRFALMTSKNRERFADAASHIFEKLRQNQ